MPKQVPKQVFSPQRFHDLWKASGLKPTEVAYIVGRTEQSFWLWHRGETTPRFYIIEKLAEAFECDPRDLFEDNGDA